MTQISDLTVLFADLRGSTALYETLGNAEATSVVTHCVSALTKPVSETGGHVVKNPAHACWDSLLDDPAYPADYNGFRPKRFTGCSYQ